MISSPSTIVWHGIPFDKAGMASLLDDIAYTGPN